ncbi:MAG: hypothetical protein IKQ37_04560 [Bacteroidaceae bacterium]|nr:hypothetical protein [Bacteroidaceae bacterium]
MNSKLKHLLLLAALACGTAWAEDNNTFYFTDTALMPGETTSIELCLRNTATDLTCLEAEIQLPEGLSVVCDKEGNPFATLYRNRLAEHEILANVLDNGNLKLLVSSIDGKVIRNGNEPLLSFRVQAAETAPIGECTVETVGETLLVSTEAEAYYCVGVTGNVLITDDETGINTIQDSSFKLQNGNAVYDLQGRKMANGKLPKGIFIKDGKKIMGK